MRVKHKGLGLIQTSPPPVEAGVHPPSRENTLWICEPLSSWLPPPPGQDFGFPMRLVKNFTCNGESAND